MSDFQNPRMRAEPGTYGESKKMVSLTLTQTAVSLLDRMSRTVQLSRSELVEQIARGMIEVQGGKLTREQAGKF